MNRVIDRTLNGQRDKLIEIACDNFREMMEGFSIPVSRCESEIEAALAVVFFANSRVPFFNDMQNTYETREWFGDGSVSLRDAVSMRFAPDTVVVIPQVIIGSYRVDFLCFMRAFNRDGTVEEWHFLAVECDGHEYHEKTKAQAARGKQRDRELLLSSIPCMRFTGSEIWADAYGCVRQVDQFFHQKRLDFMSRTALA